jgi:hypothetical protein
MKKGNEKKRKREKRIKKDRKKERLEIITSRKDLFAGRAQEEGVFELCDVRALDVA